MSENVASAGLPCASSPEWISVCAVDALAYECGVAARVGEVQIALFRLRDGRVFAIGNRDPFTGAQVLARGLIGDRAGVLKVASPLHKQSFALATGECLDDPSVRVPSYPARVREGRVEIAA
jgi:nitrite reductase (NADH) small subunit